MTNCKKAISIVIITAMVAASMPFYSFAETKSESVDAENIKETTTDDTILSSNLKGDGIKDKESVSNEMKDNPMVSRESVMTSGADIEIADAGTYAGGTGTVDDPYLIATKEQLNHVRDNLTSNYQLIQNIVFEESDFEENGAFYNDGKGWTPIGYNADKAFEGIFDGNNKTISGVYINLAENYVGLFGCSKGTISNLGIVNSNIISDMDFSNTGGITGYNLGTISNCFYDGIVKSVNEGTNNYVGGIAGTNGTNGCKINNFITAEVLLDVARFRAV